MDSEEKVHEYVKKAKHLFMTYRNGIVADVMRKSGADTRVVFGLQVPQISEIARNLKAEISSSEDNAEDMTVALADALWADKNVRESRLLACWLFTPGDVTTDKVSEMFKSLVTREEADILCFRILNKLGNKSEIADCLHEQINVLKSTESANVDIAEYCLRSLNR